MKQAIKGVHDYDSNGNPDGGETTGLGIKITWQKGPLGRGADRKEPNGAFVEGVIQAAIDRLRFYQRAGAQPYPHELAAGIKTAPPGRPGKFSCRENALAITHLEEALHWLQARTEEREYRGVEGTHEV